MTLTSRALPIVLPIALAVMAPVPATTAHAGEPETAADPASAEEKALALGHEGLTAFEQGKWQEALDRFSAAEALTHSPVFLLYAGRSLRNLGRLREAEARLDRVAGEALPADSPVAWQQAQRDARAELSALGERIPRLKVTAEPASSGPFDITVSGEPSAGGGWRLDPGEHRIVVVGAGGVRREKVVVLGEGDDESVVIALSGAPAAAPSSGDGPMWPGIALLGLGVAGLGVGAVTGLVAAGKASDLKDACGDDDRCPPALQSDGDSAETFATVSTIGFIAGGIVALAGVTLLVVRPFGGSEGESAGVAIRVGPGGASITSHF